MLKKRNSKHGLINMFKSKKNKTFNLYETYCVKERTDTDYKKEESFLGKVSSVRVMGKAYFFDVMCGKVKRQVYYKPLTLEKEDCIKALLKGLGVGDTVKVFGTSFITKTKALTLRLHKLYIISKVLKHAGVLNDNKLSRLVLKGRVLKSIRDFLNNNRFTEVETPVFQKNPGGALAKPFKTLSNGETPLYLRISLEIYLKKLIVSGFERIFELGRVFRNEGVSLNHSNEFTMLEAYSSFSEYGFMVKMLYSLVQNVTLNISANKYLLSGERVLFLGKVWRVFDYQESIRLFTGLKHWFSLGSGAKKKHCLGFKSLNNFNLSAIKDVDNFIFDKFVSNSLLQPTFITQFPRKLCPLAKLNSSNTNFVDIFEFFISGKELAPGYSEQSDPFIQSKLLIKQNKYRRDLYDKKFVDGLTKGMPFLSGIGVGIDRFIMILSNSTSIKEILIT